MFNWENVKFGVIHDEDAFIADIKRMSAKEIFQEFRYATADYDDIIAYIFELRPDVFELFEREKARLRTRVKARGIEYLFDHLDELGDDEEKLAEFIYAYSEPEDLPLIQSLPYGIRRAIDELSEYHKLFDDPYCWLWEHKLVSDEERMEMAETIYVCSAFSLNMLDELNHDISVRPLTVEDVLDFHRSPDHELVSAVGHPDTARVFGHVLGFEVPENRVTLRLATGQRVIVGQYRGPRLPAGATELPPGATIEWCLVVIGRGR